MPPPKTKREQGLQATMARKGRPKQHEAQHPAQAPLHVPAQQQVREAADRCVPGASSSRARKVVGGIVIPRTYGEAMASPEAKQWKAARAEELNSLKAHGTYVYEDCPPDVKPMPCGWAFDVKLNEAGKVARFKARVVAESSPGVPGVDSTEKFAQLSFQGTRNVFFALAAEEDWEVHHVDVNTMFFHGPLEEQVYMRQPPGFNVGNPNTVWRLVKSVNGMQQAGREWYRQMYRELRECGLAPCPVDSGLFTRKTEGQSPVFVLVSVHDMLIGGKDLAGVEATKALLKRFSTQDLGPVKYFLNTLVARDRRARTIKLTATPKIEELLVKFGQEDADPAPTPITEEFMASAHVVGAGGSGELLPPGHRYPELVKSLQELAGSVRPEIALAVGVLSQYRSHPTKAHWDAGMRVLRFLKGTKRDGIVFGRSVHPLYGCVSVSDPDAGDVDTRKPTSGYVFLMNGGPMSWCSKKQKTIASSRQDAEIIAFSEAVKESQWLTSLMQSFGRAATQIPLKSDFSIVFT